KVVPDGLLDHHAREMLRLGWADKSGRRQPLDCAAHRLRRYREVEDSIRREFLGRFDLLEALAQWAEAVGLIERAEVVEPRGELVPATLGDLEAREALDTVVRGRAELIVGQRTARKTDHRRLRRHQPLSAGAKVIERRDKFAIRKIAGCTQND